jgi:hypothetical protein
MRDFGSWPRLAKARVGQDKVMRHLEPYQLLPPAHFALAERIDSAPDRRHALANIAVEPFDKRRVDRPATSCQPLLDGPPGAEDHAVLAPHETSTPV